MLSDSTRFPGGDLGLTNRIKQTGFTVVNVTHDGHHWWTRHEIFGLVFFFGGGLFGVDFVNNVRCFADGDGLLEFHRQQFDGVFFNNRIDVRHHASHEELGDHGTGFDTRRFTEFTHGAWQRDGEFGLAREIDVFRRQRTTTVFERIAVSVKFSGGAMITRIALWTATSLRTTSRTIRPAAWTAWSARTSATTSRSWGFTAINRRKARLLARLKLRIANFLSHRQILADVVLNQTTTIFWTEVFGNHRRSSSRANRWLRQGFNAVIAFFVGGFR